MLQIMLGALRVKEGPAEDFGKGMFNHAYAIFFYFLYKSICCWCSFELPNGVTFYGLHTRN